MVHWVNGGLSQYWDSLHASYVAPLGPTYGMRIATKSTSPPGGVAVGAWSRVFSYADTQWPGGPLVYPTSSGLASAVTSYLDGEPSAFAAVNEINSAAAPLVTSGSKAIDVVAPSGRHIVSAESAQRHPDVVSDMSRTETGFQLLVPGCVLSLQGAEVRGRFEVTGLCIEPPPLA